MAVLTGLEPAGVWKYFEELSNIPRGSYHEKAASDYCVAFAKAHGLEVWQDQVWNIMMVKEASEGYEDEELMMVAYQICRWHHERYDGRGYPDGLKGDEIPISAQVVSLADVYDALVGERVYKKAYSHEKAIQMILNGECGMFNPLLLECLVEIQDKVRKELGIKSVNECLEYLEEKA